MYIDIRQIPKFYINLDCDTDKRTNVENIINKLKYQNITRIPGQIANNKKRQNGCSLSHKLIYDIVFNKFEQNEIFAIFEDDIELTDNYQNIIEAPNKFDCIFIGISNYKAKFEQISDYNELVKVSSMRSSHALILRNNKFLREAYKVINESIKNNAYHDFDVAKIFPKYNVFALKKPIFFQSSSIKPTNVHIGCH